MDPVIIKGNLFILFYHIDQTDLYEDIEHNQVIPCIV